MGEGKGEGPRAAARQKSRFTTEDTESAEEIETSLNLDDDRSGLFAHVSAPFLDQPQRRKDAKRPSALNLCVFASLPLNQALIRAISAWRSRVLCDYASGLVHAEPRRRGADGHM